MSFLFIKGECYYVKTKNNQILIVFDIKWLFDSINKLYNNTQFKDKLINNENIGLSYWTYNDLQVIMKELDIVDESQLNYLLDIYSVMELIYISNNDKHYYRMQKIKNSSKNLENKLVS